MKTWHALLCSLALWSAQVQANCFSTAAAKYGVNENLLRAIGKVESNYDPAALNPSSHAMGIMQIHPSHLPTLKGYHIEREDLFEACTNVMVGAWVLAGFIQEYGPVWRAVGAYGVGNDKRKDAARRAYAGLVAKALAKMDRRPVEVLDQRLMTEFRRTRMLVVQ